MSGGGGGTPAKAEEPAAHPPKDQLPNVSYCITSPPPWPEAILLGFQHYLVMLGTTVTIPTALVPQMGGGNEEKAKVIQTILFVSGLNTLHQKTFGTRLPAVIGPSYTFVVPTVSIILSGRWNDPDPLSKFKKVMRATQAWSRLPEYGFSVKSSGTKFYWMQLKRWDHTRRLFEHVSRRE